MVKSWVYLDPLSSLWSLLQNKTYLISFVIWLTPTPSSVHMVYVWTAPSKIGLFSCKINLVFATHRPINLLKMSIFVQCAPTIKPIQQTLLSLDDHSIDSGVALLSCATIAQKNSSNIYVSLKAQSYKNIGSWN